MSINSKNNKDNFLKSEELITKLENKLISEIKKLTTPPTLALIMVGEDKQTKKFVNAKKNKAAKLGIQFNIHQFNNIDERQLSALIGTLNASKLVDGIIVQLPLPKNLKEGNILSQIAVEKDVDNLNGGNFPPPTATGIVELLRENKIDLSKKHTVIIGGGRLVGAPLAKIFAENSWSYEQITSNASTQTDKIKNAGVVISATGVEHLIKPNMVTNNTILVDGSGVDVDVNEIKPLVGLVTPKRGAVGPLTVLILMRNVVNSAKWRQDSSK